MLIGYNNLNSIVPVNLQGQKGFLADPCQLSILNTRFLFYRGLEMASSPRSFIIFHLVVVSRVPNRFLRPKCDKVRLTRSFFQVLYEVPLLLQIWTPIGGFKLLWFQIPEKCPKNGKCFLNFRGQPLAFC